MDPLTVEFLRDKEKRSNGVRIVRYVVQKSSNAAPLIAVAEAWVVSTKLPEGSLSKVKPGGIAAGSGGCRSKLWPIAASCSLACDGAVDCGLAPDARIR